MNDFVAEACQSIARLTGVCHAHAHGVAEALSIEARRAVHAVAERARGEVEAIIAAEETARKEPAPEESLQA